MLNDPESIKLITFSIAAYRFALPLHQVLRVVNYPTPVDPALQLTGFVRLGRYLVKVLDLQQFLRTDSSTQSVFEPLFLLILASPQGEFYGIPVDRPPDVMECTAAQVQHLPLSSNPTHAVERFSHAVITCDESVNFSVFLLDLQRLLSSIASAFPPAPAFNTAIAPSPSRTHPSDPN